MAILILVVVFEIERITQKKPPVANEGAYFDAGLGCQGDRLSFVVAQTIALVCVGVLQHHGIIVMLWFNIISVYVRETLHKSDRSLS